MHSRLPNVQAPEIHAGEPFTDRKSTFQGFAAAVHHPDQVKQVMHKLLLNSKIARATHNMLVYRIYLPEKNAFLQDHDEDGEHGAGSRMAHLMQVQHRNATLGCWGPEDRPVS